MIDGIRARRRYDSLLPQDRKSLNNMIVGDHSKDRFVPPTAVAAAEEQQGSSTTASPLLPQTPSKKSRRSLKAWWRGLSTKRKVLTLSGLTILIAGLGAGAYFLFFTDKPLPIVQKPIQKQQAQPKPTTVASNLSGLQVDPSFNDRPVTAIMIENSVDARPQAGLKEASVIFEAVAEGGITRFLTLFQDGESDYIGPVRSVRPYYLQWALGFDAAIAHAGGSAQALTNIQQWGVKDLNHHASYFWRVDDRTAPHNLFTSIAKLREYEANKGFGKANFTPLPRKAEAPTKTAPTARLIDLNISSANFKVHYEYDSSTNNYRRSVGGQLHNDERSGTQLTPKVVVALIMPQGKNGIYTTYQTIGSGAAYVFQDGVVTEGTWHKNDNNANFAFTGSDGKTLSLNPGQTWFTVLGSTNHLGYGP